jgi:DNA-binding transcriptional LysR family regulator
MDKLRAIKFFCRVVESKSFAAAARDLDVAPSVLSKAIAALEADIKFRLFNRTTRRVSLTENGAGYYDRCKRLVVELEDAEVLTRDGLARPAGKLLAGLHPAINRHLMARIDRFLSEYPDIVVETTLVSTSTTLIDDKLDVLIALGDLPDSSYAMQKLGMTNFVLVASPEYLKVHGVPRTPDDLGRHMIVASGRRDGPTYAQWTMMRRARTERVFVPARVICREGVHMHEACLSGGGIGRLLELSARPYVRTGDLELLLSDWSFGALPIHALYPNRKSIPAKVHAFVNFVRSIVRERG